MLLQNPLLERRRLTGLHVRVADILRGDLVVAHLQVRSGEAGFTCGHDASSQLRGPVEEFNFIAIRRSAFRETHCGGEGNRMLRDRRVDAGDDGGGGRRLVHHCVSAPESAMGSLGSPR
jgi:hypothetical protein